MNSIIKVALATAALVGAGQASASRYLGDLARPYMTYGTTAQIATSRTSDYSGVGTLFVSTVSTATTGIGGICTGSLIGAGTVLTAAHCLATSNADPITGINFYLPSLGDRIDGLGATFSATAFAINPLYPATGLAGGNDIAAFTITGDTSAYDQYDLYLGNPLRPFTEVGTGTIGGPNGTGYVVGDDGDAVAIEPDFYKRIGRNMYEYYGSQVFADSSRGVVLYDFDDGTAAHDVFGSAGGRQQLGIVNEASASPGDSGGPEFIDGKIASVTSFGVTGAIFTGDDENPSYCGGDSIDPYNADGSTAITTDLSRCTNSSVGEIGGNTLVSYNINFVRGYLNGTVRTTAPVPEPATWAMMLGGFGIAGVSLRRRRRTGVAHA